MSDQLLGRETSSQEDESRGNENSPPDIEFTAIGNVSSRDHHHDCVITSTDPLILPGAFLKWYEIRSAEDSIPLDLVAEAQSIVTQEVSAGRLAFDHGLGFVILRYSPPLTYLIVGSWRANQENWEALYLRDLRTDGPFERTEPGKATLKLCGWELARVWYERRAWTRFLYSARDIPAKRF